MCNYKHDIARRKQQLKKKFARNRSMAHKPQKIPYLSICCGRWGSSSSNSCLHTWCYRKITCKKHRAYRLIQKNILQQWKVEHANSCQLLKKLYLDQDDQWCQLQDGYCATTTNSGANSCIISSVSKVRNTHIRGFIYLSRWFSSPCNCCMSSTLYNPKPINTLRK